MFEAIERLFNQHAFAVLLILLVSYIAQRFITVVVSRIVRQAIREDSALSTIDEQKREQTLNDILGTALRIAIWVLAGMMTLQELGVNIAPLLAGAGVLGLALGFGAQSLVKDAFTGIFIIFENQYRVGDVVEINRETAGVVERITLRQTVLRDLDGMVHHIPNGYIEMATNMTMGFANINIDIGVGYSTDLEKLEKVINKVGTTIANEDEWKDKIIEAPHFLRVDSFGDSAIVVKILGRTTADLRWEVAGEMRKRLKIAFDKNDIEIPFPQMVLHNAPKPDTTESKKRSK